MLSLSIPHAWPRLRRSVLLVLPAPAVLLALAACDATSSPLAPTGGDEPIAPAEALPSPAGETAPAGGGLAAITGPRIVFTSNRSGNGDIYLMDPQGYNVKRLTTAAATETFPAWSWQNHRIALVRPRKDASNVVHRDLYLINADGTNGRWALSTPSAYDLEHPAWSPDGSRILVTMIHQGVRYIGAVNVAGRFMDVLTSGGLPVRGKQPSYSPVGERFVYVNTRSTSYSLDLMNGDGSGHVVLGSVPGSTLDGPAFSPDGKRIAFSNTAGNGDTEIFVKSLVDGSVKRLTYSKGTDFRPTWSPDGSKIAFASTRSGRLQIWRMSATGGSATRLSRNSYDERWPSYSH